MTRREERSQLFPAKASEMLTNFASARRLDTESDTITILFSTIYGYTYFVTLVGIVSAVG